MSGIITGTWLGSGAGAADSCAPEAVNPDVFLFDPLTCVSNQFEVTGKAVILRAMRIPPDAQVCVEMVYGCGAGDEFTAFRPHGSCTVCLSCAGNVLPINIPGRYRLRLCSGTDCGPEDLVVVKQETTIDASLGGLHMSCHTCAPASSGVSITSTDATINVVRVGDSLDIGTNPLMVASEIAASAPSMTLLRAALGDTTSALPVPVTDTFGLPLYRAGNP